MGSCPLAEVGVILKEVLYSVKGDVFPGFLFFVVDVYMYCPLVDFDFDVTVYVFAYFGSCPVAAFPEALGYAVFKFFLLHVQGQVVSGLGWVCGLDHVHPAWSIISFFVTVAEFGYFVTVVVMVVVYSIGFVGGVFIAFLYGILGPFWCLPGGSGTKFVVVLSSGG